MLRTPARRNPGRSALPALAILALIGVFGVAIGVGQHAGITLPWLLGAGREQRSVPIRIVIPALDVRAEVVEVGRAEDGSIGTPSRDPVRQAGWYGKGPAPGEPGTAIVVGHVDTADEPAVFHNLAEAGPGTLVEIARRDGRNLTFAVESVERFPKMAFPADRIFDPIDRPRLALVTCGGPWLGGDVGYADNVIAFAVLTDAP